MSSSQTTSSSSQRSTELVNLTTVNNTNPTNFAPLHRTTELENLHDKINPNDDEKRTSKKILTKYMTVIGDGSDKQI
jgi:hypothetical protein